VYRPLKYERENWVSVVSTGNLEIENERKERCRKGSCSFVVKKKRDIYIA
jgi:hypothetical protein